MAEAAAGEHRLRVSGREASVLLTIVAIGLALRVWNLGAAGADHFDEGVYLLRALDLSGASRRLLPFSGADVFSPPVHVAFISFTYRLMGAPGDMGGVAVGVFFGVASIIALWWLGRSWFGPGVGIAAAALLALDEYHLALSRSALTDVTFGFFFLVALGLIARAVEGGGLARAVAGALAVGLAWNTKYHGWFALPMAATALAAWGASGQRKLSALARPAIILLLVAVGAALCYLPWALRIQSGPGGYATLTAIQRNYISAEWGSHLLEQLRYQQLLDGPWRHAAPFAALLAIIAFRGRSGFPARPAVGLVFLACISLVIGSVATLALLAAAGLVFRFRRGRLEYGAWLAAVFIGMFFVTTFFYHPYARLLVPLVLAAVLWAGTALDSIVLSAGSSAKTWRAELVAAGVGVIVVAGSLWQRGPANPWRAADGMRHATRAIAQQLHAEDRVVVVGEPSVEFYLYVLGHRSFERARNLDELAERREPVYVVTGVYARRWGPTRERLEGLIPQLRRVASYPVYPKDLRVLDDFSAKEARAWLIKPESTYVLTLYRLLPSPGGM